MIYLGFQGWPEYSFVGDWLDCNAGVPAVPPTPPSLSFSREQNMPSIEAPPISLSSNCESSKHKSLCPPPAKKANVKSMSMYSKALRLLPTQCPLLTVSTDDVAQPIVNKKIEAIIKLRLGDRQQDYVPIQSHHNMMRCQGQCAMNILN